jgi:hypothetical protein
VPARAQFTICGVHLLHWNDTFEHLDRDMRVCWRQRLSGTGRKAAVNGFHHRFGLDHGRVPRRAGVSPWEQVGYRMDLPSSRRYVWSDCANNLVTRCTPAKVWVGGLVTAETSGENY